MLSALILENFKAFGRRQVIPLAPITLIFGENSAGKSSVLQSLLLLKQTLDQTENSDALLIPRGDLTDLGNFREFVNDHDVVKVCEISPLLQMSPTLHDRISGILDPLESPKVSSIGLGLQFGLDPRGHAVKLAGIPAYWGDTERPAYRVSRVDATLKHERRGRRGASSTLVDAGDGTTSLARVTDVNPDHGLWSELYSQFTRGFDSDTICNVLGQVMAEVERTQFPPVGSEELNRFMNEACGFCIIRSDGATQEFQVPEASHILRLFLGKSLESDALVEMLLREIEAEWPRGAYTAIQVLRALRWSLDPSKVRPSARVVIGLESGAVVTSRDALEEPLSAPLGLILQQTKLLEEAQSLLHQIECEGYINLGLSADPVEPPFVGDAQQLLQGRVDALQDYSLERFVSDIDSSSSLRTATLRHFLPYATPFPPLISDEFELGMAHGWSRWNLLPNLQDLTLNLAASLRQLFSKLVYIGPLRERPERRYLFGGNPSHQVGKTGQMVPDIMYYQRTLAKKVNTLFDRFGVGYTLSIPHSREDVFQLQLRDSRTGTVVTVADVGFGISQVLPIIVQSFMSQDTTVLIEQPELHLHPRLQAELGTLFAESMADQHNQFIIETHSEHLILRLQKLIRKGQLKPSDVSVVYVMKGEEGSVCCPLRLDEEGDFIDEWPDGFFEEGYREMFE